MSETATPVDFNSLIPATNSLLPPVDSLLPVANPPLPVVNRARLRPVLPSDNDRYEKQTSTAVRHTFIAPGGSASRKAPLPAYFDRDWQRYIHPEGRPYFARHSQPTIITEACLYDATVAQSVKAWVALITDIAAEEDVCLQDHQEIFLELDDEDYGCKYYLIDHKSREVFWLCVVETGIIGLPESCSLSHLRYALDEEYWCHVEYFPMHLQSLPNDTLAELYSIFIHARSDILTSSSSTYPHTKENYVDFMDLLRKCDATNLNGYSIAFIARVWGGISHHRFITHYGEEHCRLNNYQRILEAPEIKRSAVMVVISTILFRFPDVMEARLDRLFIDEVVYQQNWRKFILNTAAEWEVYVKWTFGLLISNAVAMTVAPSSVLTQLSLVVCIAALLVGTALRERHRRFEGTSSEAWEYLSQHHKKGGFQILAAVYSLPQALFFWSLGLAVIQAMLMLFIALPLSLAVLSGIIIGSVVFSVWMTLCPTVADVFFCGASLFTFRRYKTESMEL